MSVIFHVMKEEYERLVETEISYSNAIAKLPRGTPHYRQRRNTYYLYLEYRDGNRVVQEYVGPKDSQKAKEVLEKVEQRKRYEKLLEQTRSGLKDVKKVLRGKI